MNLVQITDVTAIWTPIDDQSKEKSQNELDNLEKLSDVGAGLRDDQFLRMRELMEFFADKTAGTLKN